MARFNVFGFAWRHAHKVPAPLYRGVFDLIADVAWLTSKGGVEQLSKNLGRVRPDLDAKQLRRLSRAGMRSYMRYYGEAFVLTHLPREQINARVRAVNDGPVRAAIAAGQSPLLALSHQGNWDLAGVWATVDLSPVLTVAEELEPEEVFQEFLAFRAQLGMRILTAGHSGVFRELLRAAKTSGSLIPLLADRDLTKSGLEVEFFGRTARVAAGPATLAVASGAPLFATGIHYEKLTGDRKRTARSGWGIVLDFGPPVTYDTGAPRTAQIQQATQGWVDYIARCIHRHPQDWHMLQKVFIEDLDPQRYAAITEEREKKTDGAA